MTRPFKDQFVETQFLLDELMRLRAFNQRTVIAREMFLFAEGALVLVAIERFLRIILGREATSGDTLRNLLEKAMGRKLKLLKLDAGDTVEFQSLLASVRNALLHGNYEQAATIEGCASAKEYFGERYASQIESLYEILDGLVSQIDPATGRRYAD